mgnify:CR=1 FL=1
MGRRKSTANMTPEQYREFLAACRSARTLTRRMRRNEALSDERADELIRAKRTGGSADSIAKEVGIDAAQVDRVIGRRLRRIARAEGQDVAAVG